jgi:hypothetical protein
MGKYIATVVWYYAIDYLHRCVRILLRLSIRVLIIQCKVNNGCFLPLAQTFVLVEHAARYNKTAPTSSEEPHKLSLWETWPIRLAESKEHRDDSAVCRLRWGQVEHG